MPILSEILTAAVNDFTEHGFDSQERLDRWLAELRAAIAASLQPSSVMEQMLRDSLRAIYERLVERGEILRAHPTVERFTLQMIAPQLRGELDRRILASANLIKLNRTEAIEKTIRRFSGWATSIPKGGSETVDRRETKQEIKKAFASLPYRERFVLLDQGRKLNASISAVLAEHNGAIAATWFSHFARAGYNFRPEHAERDPDFHGKRNALVYLIRNSWEKEQGLVKVGPAGYAEDIDQPSQWPGCQCKWVYLYNLRQMPEEMLTAKGKDELEAARLQTAS